MGFSVANKVALVTGANRGIGKAIVESLLEHGAKKVYLAVRNPESTAELAAKYGDRVVTVKFDSADKALIQSVAEQTQDVDLVINNAGVLEITDPLSEGFEDSFNYEVDINVYGLVRVAQAFAPILTSKTESALVQLNSIVSMKNFTDITTYSASKAASYSVTQGLRERLEQQGVQVLSVHPGPIATDMTAKAGMYEIAESVTAVSEGIVNALKAGDFHLFPDEMAKQIGAAYQSYSDAIVTADLSGEG